MHILSYDITCLLANPPLPTLRHDAVPALHTHEYTAVHTRGQHPFSPLHISSLYFHVHCRYREYITNCKRDPGFELGATGKQIQVMARAGLEPGTAGGGLRVRHADHSATLPR